MRRTPLPRLATAAATAALAACATASRTGTTTAPAPASSAPAPASAATPPLIASDGSPVVWMPQSRVLPRTHAPQPTTAEITPADLMTRLYIFADDSMQGREAGQLGNYRGTEYIADQFRQLGLTPAGTNGTYFVTIPLKVRTLTANPSLSVAGAPLTLGADYLPVGPGPLVGSSIPVVYGGAFGDTAHMLPPAQGAGKLVVLTVQGGLAALRQVASHGAGNYQGAAGIAVVALDFLPPQFKGYFLRPRDFMDDGAAAATPQGPGAFLVSNAAAARLFDVPLAQLAVGAAGKPVAANVGFTVTPVPYPARDVVGIIPGSDPTLRGEYVAIGAHNDHVGMTRHPVDHDSVRIFNHIVRPEGADDARRQATPAQQAAVDAALAAFRAEYPGRQRADSIDNGADDDGSGTVTMLEVAQKLVSLNPRPRRSILVVSHVGEEKGLLGSEYFTDHPTVPRDSVVAQLNMDMVGRGDAWDETGRTKGGVPIHGNPNYLQLVGSRRLSTELGNLIEQVNSEDHHGLQFDYSLDANGHPANIYCRSDHYEYARYGIPITFFTTGLHSDYHQVTDEPEYIDYVHMARVGRLVEDVAVHVANLDHRPVVDHPKPDPHGVCQQ